MAPTPDQDLHATRLWDGFLTDTVRPLTPEEQRRFANKRILITGAGGYLGSALACALVRLPVRSLVLLDVAEYGLYRLDQTLRRARHAPHIQLVVGSIRDKVLLRDLFAEHAPQIVFHAAALKHVPLMEDNAIAAAEINTLGTHTLLEATARSDEESFVFLSTDKAVEPISIMGATKRIAEQLVLSARARHRVVNAVRLCNVLGSRGSVAPLFARQLARGCTVNVTHPDATRYFITRDGAVRQLLRYAVTRTTSGLVVPVTGDPVRIEDLARYMIARSHRTPESCTIAHTGLRVADKLHEQLVASSEVARGLQADPATLSVEGAVDQNTLAKALRELQAAVKARHRPRLMHAIQMVVPGYPHLRTPANQAGRDSA